MPDTAPSSLMSTYRRLPVAFVRGEGAWLFDTVGERYLDGLSGIAVCGLGHAPPALAQALAAQAQTLLHCSNLYTIPLAETLASRLCGLTGMQRAFFCNSGAEANEAAIKLARRHGHARGIERPQIIVFEGAFHGRTLATLAATGNAAAQAGFEPLPAGFIRVPFDDAAAVARVAATRADVAAVLVEPVQGEGGIRIPGSTFLPALRRLCDTHGWLLMCDEIQTGVARSGRWLASQHAEVVPDVVTLAKALGNGVPIGACLAAGAAAETLGPGSHGSTFGGNPLACRAALTVLEQIEAQALTARAAVLGERIVARLREALGAHPGVREIRHLGLLIGIELAQPAPTLPTLALAERVLINVTGERVVRLLPPLTLTDAQADELARRVIRSIERVLESSATPAAETEAAR